MIYLIYDPTDGNRITKWIQCTPETIRMQPKRTHELIAWHDGAPPQLGANPVRYDPDQRKVIDDDSPATI
jgi:hypothetical protein